MDSPLFKPENPLNEETAEVGPQGTSSDAHLVRSEPAVALLQQQEENGHAAENALGAPRFKNRLSTAQRKRLKKMREQGIDTSTIRVEPRAAAPITITPSHAVKRTMTEEKTPDEEIVKRLKEGGTGGYSAPSAALSQQEENGHAAENALGASFMDSLLFKAKNPREPSEALKEETAEVGPQGTSSNPHVRSEPAVARSQQEENGHAAENAAPRVRNRLSTAQRKKLKKMREQGIDTSNIRVEPRAAAPINSTPGHAVKRTMTEEKTPDEEIVKRLKEGGTGGHSAPSAVFIKAAVVFATYPRRQMTEADGARVNLLIEQAIDNMEEGESPNFEGSRWMGDYQGYICSNEATFFFLRKAVEVTGEFKVFLPKKLPPRIKVMAHFLRKEDEETVLRRLKGQNRGLNVEKWKILKSKVDGRGYHMVLAIDWASKEALEELNWRPHYSVTRVHFRLLEERSTQQDEVEMEMVDPGRTDQTPAQ